MSLSPVYDQPSLWLAKQIILQEAMACMLEKRNSYILMYI